MTFAFSFVVIRIGIWPYLAYLLTLDCMEVLSAGTAHSVFVVYAFLACLLGLTLLQFFWLTEIVRQGTSEVRAIFNKGKRD